MTLLLNILLWVYTVVLGLSLLAGLVWFALGRVRTKPNPLLAWSAILQLAFFFASGVVLLITHGHAGKASILLMVLGCTVAWPRFWKIGKAGRNQRAL